MVAPEPVSALLRTLAVDVGGSGIKAVLLDERGQPISERLRVRTPKNATPKKVVRAIAKLAKAQAGFDRISVGFPGVVKDGVVYTAPNLGEGWKGFDLARALEKKFRCPVRVANDAVVQGLAAVSGRGVELVITLGTGVGSVLFDDGRPVPLEIGHHPFHKGKTYEEELGKRALKKKGKSKWNKLLREAIDDLSRTFNYDRLYLGGGNTKYISFALPPNVQVIDNISGLLGGIALWRERGDRRPAVQGRKVKNMKEGLKHLTSASSSVASTAVGTETRESGPFGHQA